MADDGQYLAKLRDYYTRHRVLPSYSRIGSLVGLSSKASVAQMVQRLKGEGFLESSPDRRLKPGPRFFERPFASSKVAAGSPSAVADDLQDDVAIDQELVRHPSRTVLVTVKGDSMIEAGLLPGDKVVVERRHTAAEGDIVVAIVDNESTIKRLVKERGRFILKPENKAYPVLRPKELEIFGVVVGSYRKYR
ncbi:MAG TPA: LexA family transcriptional regulator [Burkholderiales bacterium]|nr:LexA family transcriptional regulator [Burkholderiales bacterium]